MEFIINNPNNPDNMFPGQPMNVYQNPQYSYNFFDTKKVILFYNGSTSGSLVNSNTIYTQTGINVSRDPDGTYTSSDPQSGSYASCTYESNGKFKFSLVEPLNIDKMSDVFLDNITIANTSFNASTSLPDYGVALQINELQQNIVSNNQNINNRELIVINSQSPAAAGYPDFYESKNKKFNYLGVLKSGKYNEMNGVLCKLDGTGLDDNEKTLCFSIELIISNKN